MEDEETKTKYVVFRDDWEKARIKEEQRRTLAIQARSWKEEKPTGKGLNRILCDLNIPKNSQEESKKSRDVDP
jgi:hypothetical protein